MRAFVSVLIPLEREHCNKWLDLSPLAAKKGNEGVHFVRCIRFVNRKSYILWFISLADDCNKNDSSLTVFTRHAVREIFSN